jgi:hypothetical protein
MESVPGCSSSARNAEKAMPRRRLLVAAIAGAGLLASGPAVSAPKSGERVTVTACPVPGVTANCLMMRAGDGTIYNIGAASPRPRPSGMMIRLRGVATDKFSMCGQGIVLERIRWTRTRLRCPN